jgi:hypothetical protein
MNKDRNSNGDNPLNESDEEFLRRVAQRKVGDRIRERHTKPSSTRYTFGGFSLSGFSNLFGGDINVLIGYAAAVLFLSLAVVLYLGYNTAYIPEQARNTMSFVLVLYSIYRFMSARSKQAAQKRLKQLADDDDDEIDDHRSRRTGGR